MGRFRNWWHSVLVLSQQSPPQVVEALLLLLALPLLILWLVVDTWPYLALSLSYIVGAIASILVREHLAPSSDSHQVRATAFLSLLSLLTGVGIYLMKTTSHLWQLLT